MKFCKYCGYKGSGDAFYIMGKDSIGINHYNTIIRCPRCESLDVVEVFENKKTKKMKNEDKKLFMGCERAIVTEYTRRMFYPGENEQAIFHEDPQDIYEVDMKYRSFIPNPSLRS